MWQKGPLPHVLCAPRFDKWLKARGADADAPLEGTAIRNQTASDLHPARTPAGPRARTRTAASPGGGRRFSPLTTRQREGVDVFLEEARPWALRQARRTYRHLPVELQTQAVDDAMAVLHAGAGASDRRALYSELAEALDASLRRVHVGWCLSQAPSLYQGRPGTESDRGVPTPPGEPISAFIEDGLGGLERAVLQLEIGAGRDSSVVRAALKLGPRQYSRHRDIGLAKLRIAIHQQLTGRVCDNHLEAVTLAATGDRGAGDELAAGRERCRSCAREAGLMRRVLHERLAMAPWPLAIKPAGIIAAKLGGLAAIVSGTKSVGSGSLVTSAASGASPVLATNLAASVVATGTIAATGVGGQHRSPANAPTSATAAPAVASAPESAAKATTRATAAAKTRSAVRRTSASARGTATTAAPPLTAAAQTVADAAPTGTAQPASPSIKPVTEPVRKVVDQVTRKVPSKIKVPATDVEVPVPDLNAPVDKVTGAVDDLLAP